MSYYTLRHPNVAEPVTTPSEDMRDFLAGRGWKVVETRDDPPPPPEPEPDDPAEAGGMIASASGLALVGEPGPEKITLPVGATLNGDISVIKNIVDQMDEADSVEPPAETSPGEQPGARKKGR